MRHQVVLQWPGEAISGREPAFAEIHTSGRVAEGVARAHGQSPRPGRAVLCLIPSKARQPDDFYWMDGEDYPRIPARRFTAQDVRRLIVRLLGRLTA